MTINYMLEIHIPIEDPDGIQVRLGRNGRTIRTEKGALLPVLAAVPEAILADLTEEM